MNERKVGLLPRGRTGSRSRITGAAVTAIALLALGLAIPSGIASPSPGRGDAQTAASTAAIHPAVTPATGLWVNRSQSSATYQNEYISFNNSTTLYRIPTSICAAGCVQTVSLSATNCRWVTVQNLTTGSNPASVFHNIQYRNVTAANASGAVTAGTGIHAFKICGGTALWVNFVYWTYSIYTFSAPSLGVNTTVTFGGFSAVWPGSSAAGPVNVSAKLGPKAAAQLIVATNLTFSVVFQLQANGSTSCDITGQVCSFTQYTFLSATDVANLSKTITLKFNAATGLRVNAAYQNWTVAYANASIGANTAWGGFFVSTGSVLTTYVVNLWWAWIVVIFLIIIVALASRSSSRSRRN